MNFSILQFLSFHRFYYFFYFLFPFRILCYFSWTMFNDWHDWTGDCLIGWKMLIIRFAVMWNRTCVQSMVRMNIWNINISYRILCWILIGKISKWREKTVDGDVYICVRMKCFSTDWCSVWKTKQKKKEKCISNSF